MTRLRSAVDDGQLSAGADLDAVADALIGSLLFQTLTRLNPGDALRARFDGLLDAMLRGIANQ
jgi:hypothetical protein